ncbi:unnamed protein product, partial [Pylaiella littoralis]
MPHTNRARRADHFRSIDNTNSNSSNVNTSKPGGRRHSQHGQDDGGAFDHDLGSRNDAPERFGGRSAGRGAGGRGAGRGGQGGAFGRGGGARAARGPVAGAPTTAAAGGKGKSRTPSMKNRIRSLTRLMNRPGIEEEQRLHLKTQVEELEGKFSERQKHERERTLAIKYHKAKFFDRRKALRRLAQIHRKLQGDIEEAVRAELERNRESEEADLKYVLYFPKDKKYLPLGKGKEGPPRAQRSHERFLKEALARGEAAGWTEFQDNLNKFVTSSAGGGPERAAPSPSLEAEDANAGDGRGLKRKKEIDSLPVVAQENIWNEEDDRSSKEQEEEEEGEGGEEGDAVNAGDDEVAGAEAAPAATDTASALLRKKSSKDKKNLSAQVESGPRTSQPESSDSEGELSGDEGFGAAASDEEEAYSFAEARMRWASGGRGGGEGGGEGGSAGTERASGGASDGSSDGHDSDESVGQIDARALGRSNGGGSSSKAAKDDGSHDSSSDDSSSDSCSSDAGERTPVREENHASRPPATSPPQGSDDDEDSGDDIDLNDDFFMEEKGTGAGEETNNGMVATTPAAGGKNARARRDERRNTSGRGGGGGRVGGGRGHRTGRGGRGRHGPGRGGYERGRGRSSFGSGGGRAAERGFSADYDPSKSSNGGTGGRGGTGRAWVPHG